MRASRTTLELFVRLALAWAAVGCTQPGNARLDASDGAPPSSADGSAGARNAGHAGAAPGGMGGTTPRSDAGATIDTRTDGAPAADGARVDAGVPGSCGEPPRELSPCPCRFGRQGNPSSFAEGLSRADLINAPSERLAAPPGGLWWIREELREPVAAQTANGQIRELAVVERVVETQGGPYTLLRVPNDLPKGTALTLAGRRLTVASMTAGTLALDRLFAWVHRPDLGGTGFSVDLPAADLGRVVVLRGFVHHRSAAFVFGVRVLEGLLLADADRLCDLDAKQGGPVFVPMWNGKLPFNASLGLFVTDADRYEVRAIMLPAP